MTKHEKIPEAQLIRILDKGDAPCPAVVGLFGCTGAGKSHWLRTLAERAMQRPSAGSVIRTTGEGWVNELLASLNAEERVAFPPYSLGAGDLLLMDDVHVVAGKRRTQVELFRTILDVFERGGQVVYTCLRPHGCLETLEELLAGLGPVHRAVELEPPGADVVARVLGQRARLRGVVLPGVILDRLVDETDGDLGTALGRMNRLLADHEYLGRDLLLA